MTCFDWPRQAAFGRVIPKSRIYEAAQLGAAMKAQFVDSVGRITWSHKLAPETVNLTATKSVPELQVITILTKANDLDDSVLKAIDKAIPFPLIFELHHDGKRRMVAGYKRPSEADASKWVTSGYFGTDWEDKDAPRQPLPVALDLSALYEALLNVIMPDVMNDNPAKPNRLGEAGQAAFEAQPSPVTPPQTMQERVDRLEAIAAQTREIERIRARLNRTKQFNKRIEVNAELREALEQLESLKRASQ